MNKRFLVIIVVCVAVFAGLLVFNKKDSNTTNVNAEPSAHYYGAIDESATSDGNAWRKAPQQDAVVLTEYGDFQCPACGIYYQIVDQVKTKYKDQLAFQYRNYPLVSLHPNAMAAHKAAEAAARQGKFWEMYDLIYQNQDSWKDSNSPQNTFEGYAQQLNLDIEKFRSDVASEEVNAVIQADMKAGQDLDITGTPTFLIDGKKIENPTSADAFEKLIQDAIQSKKTS